MSTLRSDVSQCQQLAEERHNDPLFLIVEGCPVLHNLTGFVVLNNFNV